jgi:signal transduction histidine kinase
VKKASQRKREKGSEVKSSVLLNLTPTAAPSIARTVQAARPGFTALSANILKRAQAWSDKARALKFEMEFKLVEQERRRVAKELHDEVLPHLSRLVRTLQSTEDKIETQQIVLALHDLNQTLRDLLAELHPVDLEELGLSSAVQNLCHRYSRHYKTSINCKEENEVCCLSDLQQLAIYRALQLALKYFAESGRDSSNLLVRYRCANGTARLGLGLDSKKQYVAKELLQSMPEQELDAFFTWCSLAGAELQFTTWSKNQSNTFLVLTASDSRSTTQSASNEQFDLSDQIDQLSKIRLNELEQIMAIAQSEWTDLLERNSNFSEPMTIALERKRLLSEIERIVSPGFTQVESLADELVNCTTGRAAKTSMAAAKKLVDTVISESYPRQLEHLNLVSMIKLLVNKFNRATLIKPNLIVGASTTNIKLDINKKLAVYRIVQEALNNIEKHSEAKNVLVLIEPEQDSLVICIEDDGIGFNQAQNCIHRGLKNIKERAQTVDGTVTWQDSISYQSGTLLTIKLKDLPEH